MKETRTYPLRLPRSLKEAAERLSREDRTSLNQFVVTAVAEKVSAMQTAEYFSERRARADFAAFDKIMRRQGGSAPREDDTVPDSKPRARRARQPARPK
ncbi:MAG: toxin-antitoxin system HicB family antitoxin [Bryobacterales bacterium]|nr:toxin-antitoxin system HicB family antitoxin [Bryobacterales bacterium]